MKLYFTIPETAEYLGISERACWQRLYRGVLPYRRWSGRVVVPLRELEKFLESLPGVSATEAVAKVEEK